MSSSLLVSSSKSNFLNTKQLRQSLRFARRNLTPAQQIAASERLVQQVANQPYFLTAKSFAIYLAADGELNTQPLIELAWQLNKEVYLPRLNLLNKGYLDFLPYELTSQLAANRYNLKEPVFSADKLINPVNLDIIFLPLVGFDKNNNRLGMGGGYYDRSLERLSTSYRKPKLIGLAHQCQQVKKLTPQPWDIPLDAVVVC